VFSSVSLLDRDSPDPPFLQPDDARAKRLAVLLFEVARSLDHDLATALPRLEVDPKLAALRSLILEEDRAAIARLQQKFDDPRQFAEAVSAVLADALPERKTNNWQRRWRQSWSWRPRHRSAKIQAPWLASSTP
jgi:hypothetical protein